LVFSLYVGVTVLELPQDRLRGKFCFAAETFFGVCFGVGYEFFFTCPAWLHVESRPGVDVGTSRVVFFPTRINEHRNANRALAWPMTAS
jgi:hypothetical protein